MSVDPGNPFAPIIERQGLVILDGGLATTLEDRGCDLDDPLWSARLLLEDPAAIGEVHEDFLRAGSDVVTTATYQASLMGLAARGLDAEAAAALIRRGVDLAVEARDRIADENTWGHDRPRPLVAASVGPFGAYLADGSEYDGRYGIDAEDLLAFHRSRWEILAGSGAEILACETLPSFLEAEVLLQLLAETPERWAWLSFSCRDGEHLWDGTPLREAVRRCRDTGRVAAVGINCTDPNHIDGLLDEALRETDLPVIVYPNSGEVYDAGRRSWLPGPRQAGCFAEQAESWRDRGARGIGGCCRVGPEDISELRLRLLGR